MMRPDYEAPLKTFASPDWGFPFCVKDVSERMVGLLETYGIPRGHPWGEIACRGTAHTIKGLEYAASAVSMLPSETSQKGLLYLTDVLASFEIWRHGANIFDDFTDEELHRTEYRSLVAPPLTDGELLIVQNAFHFMGITRMVVLQHERQLCTNGLSNDIPDVATMFGKIYMGWLDKTVAMKQRAIWDATGDPLQSYWDEHIPVSTAWFYQIPFTLIGLTSENPRLQLAISHAGYRLGELIHCKNDLQDLAGDIEGGDFSYPVILGFLEGVVSSEELVDASYASREKDAIVGRLASAGMISRYVELIEAKITQTKVHIKSVLVEGGDCAAIVRIVNYLDRRIHEVEQTYLQQS